MPLAIDGDDFGSCQAVRLHLPDTFGRKQVGFLAAQDHQRDAVEPPILRPEGRQRPREVDGLQCPQELRVMVGNELTLLLAIDRAGVAQPVRVVERGKLVAKRLFLELDRLIHVTGAGHLAQL